MNKKVLFAYIVLIGCIALLVGSYMQWKGKIFSVAVQSPILITETTPYTSDVENGDDEKNVELVKPELTVERLLLLTANQDEQVRDVFQDRLETEEVVNFLIVGSTAMNDGGPGYAERLGSALEDTYGDFVNLVTVAVDGTSGEFIDGFMEEQIDFGSKFDVVLFEPFTLRNNGVVTIDNEHVHIDEFRGRLLELVEDAVIVLHPPYPIYAANYYPTQVSALKSFADSKGFPYIDHWQNWPDPDSEEILDYLEDKSVPNSRGAEVWANALLDYFIAE